MSDADSEAEFVGDKNPEAQTVADKFAAVDEAEAKAKLVRQGLSVVVTQFDRKQMLAAKQLSVTLLDVIQGMGEALLSGTSSISPEVVRAIGDLLAHAQAASNIAATIEARYDLRKL